MKLYIGNNLIAYPGFTNCTIEDCYRYCSKQKVLAIDIETSRKYPKGTYSEDVHIPGLDPYLSRICMFQIGDLNHQFVIDVRVINISILLPLLESKQIIKIIQNAQFECKHFLHNYNIRIRNIWDTMIVEKLLFNGIPQSYSLKAIAQRRLGLKEEELTLFSNSYSVDEEIIEEEEDELDIFGFKKEFIDKSIRSQFVEWGFKPFTLDQIEYGARDITLPYRIYLMQLEGRKINGQTWFPFYGVELENDTTFVLAEMTYRGVPIDSEAWLQTEAENQVIYSKRIKSINKYVEENEYNNPKVCYHADLFNDKPTCKIQWSSPKQVIDLYRSWGICPKEKSKQTGKDEWSVGAKALFKTLPNNLKKDFLNDVFPEIIDSRELFTLAYLLFKKSEQLITTFGKDWLKYVHPITRRGHPNFNQLMNTTRLSSSNFNVQQLPRTENFRKCIASKNGELICDDFSSQEVYAGAVVHESKPLIKFFDEGDETYGTD